MVAKTQLPTAHRSGLPRVTVVLALLFCCLVFAGCADNSANMLNAAGPAAEKINTLWWFMFAVGGVVYLVVMGYMLLALFRRRSDSEQAETPREGTSIVVWGGAIIPGIILAITFGATVFTMGALNQPETANDLVIEVTGNQWWWDVRYPGFGFRTANEIHIPVGQPVAIKLHSEDVIHSFWVPKLHGKLDMLPGQVTEFWLEADEEGVYLGECAEFCGIQHAKMQFLVIAMEPEAFELWVADQQQPARQPRDTMAQEGQRIFLDSTCINCHRIEGTDATGELGPDLTHLASRRTLAAGTVPNNRGNLGGWIVAPDGIKPGSLMPPTPLTGAELQALLTYLETLE